MRGHNTYFHQEIKKSISELSSFPFLSGALEIWWDWATFFTQKNKRGVYLKKYDVLFCFHFSSSPRAVKGVEGEIFSTDKKCKNPCLVCKEICLSYLPKSVTFYDTYSHVLDRRGNF